MKNVIFFFAMTLTTQVFASDRVIEFDEVQEQKCHQELKSMGCVNASGEQVKTCAKQKRSKMSKECGQIHDQQAAN